MGKRDRELVRRIATGLIQREGLTLQLDKNKYQRLFVKGEDPNVDLAVCSATPYHVWDFASTTVTKTVKALKPETLGRIVSTGRPHADALHATTLYEVHCQSYLSKYAGGQKLLVKLAATAVAAKMWDLLVEKFRAENQSAEIAYNS